MGVLQLLDEDETTVLFDFHDPTGAANPGTVSTKLGAEMLASSLRAAGRLPGQRSARLP